MAKNTDVKNFDAIAEAMNSGNHEELDRLMAAEADVEEEEVIEEEEVEVELPIEDDAKEEEEESESPPEVKVDDDDTGKTPEAATAASTAEQDREKELQRLRSDAGRVPSIQRRMAELERELRTYKARDSQTTLGKDGKPTVDAKDIVLDEETQREIDELREVDPVLAKTLERIAKASVATAKASADHVVTTFTQADQDQDDFNFLTEQKAELVRDIPQADAIFATPEWKQWKDTLTPGQRGLAESSYASEVKQAIYAFAAVMQQNQAAPVVVTPPVEDTKLKEDRQRKVGASAEVKASAAKKVIELDEDAYFTEQYNKIGKENHILK